MLRLIQEITNNFHEKGTEYDERVRETEFCENDGFIWVQSQGKFRVLEPRILSRFPKHDRIEKLFPMSFQDYFFEQMETVYTLEDV